jgi:hypothetical protein
MTLSRNELTLLRILRAGRLLIGWLRPKYRALVPRLTKLGLIHKGELVRLTARGERI